MEPAARGLPSHSFFAPVLKYLEARGLLLSIETREALQNVIKLGLWLAVAVVALFAGWLLLVTALVGWLSSSLGWWWVTAAGVTGGAHLVVVTIACVLMRIRLKGSHWFAATLNELKNDRAWLQKNPTRS